MNLGVLPLKVACKTMFTLGPGLPAAGLVPLSQALTTCSCLPHHRSDALQGMLVLAAATQHAEGSKEAGALQQAQEAVAAAAAAGVPEHLPRGRQESVSSDYSEGQQYDAALRTAQRGALHHESEEEKREKR